MPAPPTGTILLVDDEDGVRVTLRRQLVAQGHTVLEASHGAEAIAVVRMRRGNLDLVLSDVVMPEMNGTELAASLLRDYPGLPVILMSAYAPAGLTQVGPGSHKSPGAPEAVRLGTARGADSGIAGDAGPGAGGKPGRPLRSDPGYRQPATTTPWRVVAGVFFRSNAQCRARLHLSGVPPGDLRERGTSPAARRPGRRPRAGGLAAGSRPASAFAPTRPPPAPAARPSGRARAGIRPARTAGRRSVPRSSGTRARRTRCCRGSRGRAAGRTPYRSAITTASPMHSIAAAMKLRTSMPTRAGRDERGRGRKIE